MRTNTRRSLRCITGGKHRQYCTLRGQLPPTEVRGSPALKIPFRLSAGNGISIERYASLFLIYGTGICPVDAGVAGSEEIVFA